MPTYKAGAGPSGYTYSPTSWGSRTLSIRTTSYRHGGKGGGRTHSVGIIAATVPSAFVAALAPLRGIGSNVADGDALGGYGGGEVSQGGEEDEDGLNFGESEGDG